jgi:1-acyl-sn-glycerol-3-phosphate acyltransferase
LSGVENIPRGRPYVVAINHVSIIDPPFTLCFWPEILEVIGAIDVFEKPMQGELLRLYGVIPVHRGDYDRVLIENVLSLLRAGRPLLIAPEGRRSHVTGMQTARPGVGFILRKAGVPVLPVGLVGTTADFASRGLRAQRPVIEMRIGRPIALPPVSENPVERREDRQRVADLVMSHIAGLLPPEYRGVYAETAIAPA